MTPVQISQVLLSSMTMQELAAYRNCPLNLQEHFERIMMDKYGIEVRA